MMGQACCSALKASPTMCFTNTPYVIHIDKYEQQNVSLPRPFYSFPNTFNHEVICRENTIAAVKFVVIVTYSDFRLETVLSKQKYKGFWASK